MPYDSSGSKDSVIAKKIINQNGGPVVEPCPGPNSGVLAMLLDVIFEVP